MREEMKEITSKVQQAAKGVAPKKSKKSSKAGSSRAQPQPKESAEVEDADNDLPGAEDFGGDNEDGILSKVKTMAVAGISVAITNRAVFMFLGSCAAIYLYGDQMSV